jgi:hypothetical protein
VSRAEKLSQGLALKTRRDGLHLSTRGYDAVWAKISDIVKNDFRGRGVDWDDVQNLPLTLPE